MKILSKNTEYTHVETKEDDTLIINSESIQLVVKHNDIGISIDVYELHSPNTPPVKELQYHFDDFKTDES